MRLYLSIVDHYQLTRISAGDREGLPGRYCRDI
jgi:hypothetical protein